ncbi:adenylyltransferase/sulfurtransferase MoeZ [Mucilaginibacter gynuensis]|uniref:Adenylyltransferase/sulfurtransferase MoeZ n=1 Tax=Mucilaginibacter gynuensis TaxID=1302236 RepID=A0ABP8G0N8_9SPHI
METGFERYSCQIALPGFSETSQRLLQQAKVLVVGAGGLGCPAAQYLAAAGIGTLGIADHDNVSVSNLHRQVLFGPADVGRNKAEVAAERLRLQNPAITIVPYNQKIVHENVLQLVAEYDIVVDCTDNFATRYLLNDAAVLAGKPVVYGAIYQFEGQVAIWNVRNSNGYYTPNYRDLFPKVNESQIPNCTEGGVIPTLAGIIGCMQANEVIKYISQNGELLTGKVLIFDAQSMRSRIIKIGNITQTYITALPISIEQPVITVADLKQALAANSVELIDVRNADERELFDIGGRHIPLNELENNIDQLNTDIVKVFYCASGIRSAEAVRLFKLKYPEVKAFSLEGGLKAWRG